MFPSEKRVLINDGSSKPIVRKALKAPPPCPRITTLGIVPPDLENIPSCAGAQRENIGTRIAKFSTLFFKIVWGPPARTQDQNTQTKWYQGKEQIPICNFGCSIPHTRSEFREIRLQIEKNQSITSFRFVHYSSIIQNKLNQKN